MYRITIYNGGTPTIIQEVSTDPADPHLYSATLTEGSPGEIDSVEFTILPNNPGYDLLYSRTTAITVTNTKTGLAEFKGRVLTVTPEMQDNGMVYKSVVCESRLGYLCDSIQPYTEEQTYVLEDFFKLLLENHNSQVEDYKKIYPGTISATASASTGNVTKGLNYQTTWDALKEKLLDTEGGELLLYDGTDGRMYLDYVDELGSRGEQTIELGVNMRSVKQEIDPTEVITRLIPLGAKLEDEDGNETEERLTIESVNGGSIYLDDEDAQELYGIVAGTVEWEDVTEASNLLTKAQNWLDSQTVTDRITIDAVDLWLLGLAEDSLERYNYYRIINSAIGLDAYFRVVKRTVDLCDPSNITYEMGEQSKSMSSTVSTASSNAAGAVDDAAALAAELSKTVASLIAANAEIASLSSIVATIESAYIDTATIDTLLAKYATIETLEADYITSEEIEAAYVRSDNLYAAVAEFGYLKATDAEFTNLSAAVATIENAYISEATVETLLADYVKTENLESEVAEFGYLKATDSVLTNLISQVSVIENAYITTERVNTLLADYVKTDELEADVAEFGYLKTANLDAEAATLGYLKATDADFTTLTADVATIKEAYISAETVGTLLADYVKTDELEADVAEFGYLKTVNLDAEAAILGYLKATDADFTTLSADVATIKAAYIDTETVNDLLASYIKTTELEAAVAEFGYVKSTYLNTYYLTAEQIETAYVTADTLTTSYLDADTIASTYIKADLTNFTTTMMGTLLADAGIVTSMTIQDGYVTGELSSVTINADLITTGTLSVERLLIVGEDGIIYQINAQSGGLTETELTDEVYQNYINGTALVAKSVTADQIAAGTITAAEIAANSITADRMDVSELSSITADVGLLTAGILMSQNYVAGESGIYIDLNAGTIDCEELIVTASERILLTASQTYATLEDYSTLASSLDKAVVSVVAYFAISDSADEYPDFETAEGAASYAGIARAGLWLAGYYGWATEMPVYEDGDYVWLAYLKTYADGSTEWTEPALIVDGSLSEQIVSVKQTTASVQVLADSILQVVTSTNATWYTGDYVIAVTSCGDPDEVGCDASLYEGLYYLDQTTGYVYLSDGKSWEKAAELESTVSTMQTLVENTESSIKSTVSSWVGAVTVYYGTCSSNAGYPYKTVECGSFDADSLVAGASIRITFANGNKAYPLLLNINGTGSVPAYVDGANFNADSDTWDKNATAVFEYDGTVWNLVETGSYAYAQTLVEQTAETWSATLTENYATKASLALTLAEETDEDGTTHTYGTLSGYAEYIKFEAKEFIVDAGNFSIDADSSVRAGGFMIGENALYNGTESMGSWEAGAYVGTDGIRYVANDDEEYAFVQLDKSGISLFDNIGYTSTNGTHHYEVGLSNTTVSMGFNTLGDDAGTDFHGGGISFGKVGSYSMPRFAVYGRAAAERLIIAPFSDTDNISAGANGYIRTDLITTINNDLTVTGEISNGGEGTIVMRSGAGIVCTNSEGVSVTIDDEAYSACKIGGEAAISVYTYGYEDSSKDLVGRFDINNDGLTASSASTSGWLEINNLKEQLTINGSSLKALQHGTTDALTVSSSGAATTTVAFDKEFPETPTVVVTAVGGYYDIFATVVNVSTTHCVIALYNTGSSGRSGMKAAWMAVC